MDGAPSMSDIVLTPDNVTAFESAVASPVTEFGEITVKAGADAARVEVLAKELQAIGQASRGAGGAGFAMGKNAGDANKWLFVVGWESVQVNLILLELVDITDACL
jgi:hypothetical protein